ncbi:unnamed protein product [Effrenium voratum]|nr:unnamed protein product [Effrenium voratum]
MQKGWGGKGAAAPIIPPAATFKGVPPAFKARQSWPQPMPQQQWQVPQAQAQWQKDPWKKEPWQKEDQGPPTVYPLQLLQESQLTTQGFPPEAPALVHDKAMTVFSAGHSILQELVGDIGSEVEIHHDPDWDIFPEVGEAIKNAGAEQLCFSVATCPNQGKWAVGIANGWKGRETASKLALSFALLAERPPSDLEDFCKNYPEFRAMVAEAGLLPSGPPKRSAPVGKGNSWPHVPAAHAAPVPHAPHAPAHAPPQSFAGGFPPFVWATLDASAGLVQDGLPPEGLCVYHDKQSSDLFRSGQSILQEAGYGGRFTYGQWRRFFAFRVERSPSVLDARAREGPTHFSWQRPFVEFFRPEIWLLILLHSDAAAMGRLASCCWAHARLYLPWQRRGVKREDPLCEPEMHVAQLAARLRCGLPWAEELLDLEEISPPVGSWLELLYQQEAQGAWLCLVCTGHRGELVRNFCAAVALAEQRPDPDCPVIIALLPSVQHVHVTAGSRVCIQKALKILGLPLPYLSGGDFELRSRWQSPAIPKGGRRYLPTLSLQSLEVRLDGGCVELQNCVLYGHGTTEDSPRGVGDCVLRVSSGTCLLADCQVRLRKGSMEPMPHAMYTISRGVLLSSRAQALEHPAAGIRVLGDASGEVIYTHDPDWDVMPEMAEAIRSAGGEDNCYAVATLPSHGIWAVGLAGGWKPREAACKLALSVALVTVSGDLDRFAQSYPDFVSFCQVAGTPGAQEPVAKKQRVAEPAAKKVPPAKGLAEASPAARAKERRAAFSGQPTSFRSLCLEIPRYGYSCLKNS